MPVSNNGKLAQWLDDFINVLSKKDIVAAEQERLAEVNIHDLPKVVWNDETFYVMFDQTGATILNEFANVVTTLQGVTTIEEVDNKLNSKQVVTSVDPFEEELKKISTYLVADVNDPNNPDPNAINTNTTPAPAPIPDASQTPPAGVTQPVPDPNNPAPVVDPNAPQTTAALNEGEEEMDIDDMDKEIESMNSDLDIREKYAKLEVMYNDLAKKVEALTQQQYGHTDPGAIYDSGIQDAELQHVQEMMNASQEQINKEHNVDLTTPAGRISLRDQLSDDMNSIMDEEPLTDPNAEEKVDEEVEVEMESNENPSNEEPKEDELVEEELPTLDLEVPGDGTNMPNVKDNFDNMNQENHDNLEVVKDELTDGKDTEKEPEEVTEKPVEKSTEEVTEEPVEEEPIKKESSLNNGITVLSAKEAKLFKKQICPACCESELVKDRAVGNLVGIYCKACNKEYAVNMETEEIYSK